MNTPPIDFSKWPTAHQVAKTLLAGPDHILVFPLPIFDMPGHMSAYPARVHSVKISGVDAVVIEPDVHFGETPATPPDQTKSSEGAPNANPS
jgi:hypothetical protein